MTATITRLYNSHAEAEAVVSALRSANVGERNISVLVSNADEWHRDNKPATYPDKDLDGRDDRGEAATAGAGVGAAVGGTLGALTGLGIMAIPGVGPVVAAGWLVATLAGAVAGGVTGGAIGALTQVGATPEEAEVYAEALRRGGAVVSVKAEDAERGRIEFDYGSVVGKRDRTRRGLSKGWMEPFRCRGAAVHRRAGAPRARPLPLRAQVNMVGKPAAGIWKPAKSAFGDRHLTAPGRSHWRERPWDSASLQCDPDKYGEAYSAGRSSNLRSE